MKKIHRGDDGFTDVVWGRVPKDSHIIEFLGGIDELVSFLGIVRGAVARLSNANFIEVSIKNIQKVLMTIGSSVAGKIHIDDAGFRKYVIDVEKEIEMLSQKIASGPCLVIPGSSYESSLLHLARALCRYVERRATPLLREGLISKSAYAYLNRLSDLLYLYAIYVDVLRGIATECFNSND